MGLRDMLRRKDEPRDVVLERAAGEEEEEEEEKKQDQEKEEEQEEDKATRNVDGGAEFRFVRTDTTSQQIIQPPDAGDGGGLGSNQNLLTPRPNSARSPQRSLDVLRPGSRGRSGSVSSQTSHSSSGKRRLSERLLHLGRSSAESSEHVPQNLPEITAPADPTDQSQWEKRATMLVGQNSRNLARIAPAEMPALPGGEPESESQLQLQPQLQPQPQPQPQMLGLQPQGSRSRSPSPAPAVSSKAIDEDIQEAIRLHEEGDLAKSTEMFGRLADPQGANNPLSQVLYGLAL
ncbi:hypothetical protein E4U41_006138, partial [Claviceps citrina]